MSETELSTRGQRDFIHDLSSPLTVALGMVDSALRSTKESDAKAAEKLEKARSALVKMSEILKSRRQLLIDSEKGTT